MADSIHAYAPRIPAGTRIFLDPRGENLAGRPSIEEWEAQWGAANGVIKGVWERAPGRYFQPGVSH